jgi:RNA polymerase sigma factor (sigma-70 family)
MPGGPSGVTLRDLQVLFQLGVTGDFSDGQLLDRFVGPRDAGAEEAFAILVRRHGPMVLGVCRRVLSGSHEAEDAFQATFLVLARKAATIARRESLANWLYGVALRTAKDSRARAMRRRAWEERARTLRVIPAREGDRVDELRDILDDELSRLPARLRTPLLLCELESVSRHEAARRLGIPEGTLSSRLARAKSLLRDRLTRRGLGLPAAAMASVLAREAQSASVPHALAEITIQAATRLAAGCSLSGLVAAPVYSLTTEVLRTMCIAQIRGVAVGLLMFGTAITGAVVLAQVPKNNDSPSSTLPARPEARQSAPDPFATKPVEGQSPADPGVSAHSDSDRLHVVEQKLDRILEALGGTRPAQEIPIYGRRGNGDGPTMYRVPAYRYVPPSTRVEPPVVAAAPAPGGTGSLAQTQADFPPDRLASVERRMAELERRMSELERRVNQQSPVPGTTSAPAGLPPMSAFPPSSLPRP